MGSSMLLVIAGPLLRLVLGSLMGSVMGLVLGLVMGSIMGSVNSSPILKSRVDQPVN